MCQATLLLSIKRLLRALPLILGLVLLTSQTAIGAANPSDEGCNQDDECRDHFVKGKSLYKQQDYTSALKEFQTAYERRQTPILLANIGRTLQKLGRPKEALDYYLRCQEAAKTDTDLQQKLKVYIAESRALLSTSAPIITPEPEVTEPAPAPLLTPSPSDQTHKPVYKKGWFWAVIGISAAVVIGGVVTGVVLATRPGPMADPAIDPTVTVIRPMF